MSVSPNAVRGETVIEIDGAPRRLRFTLGALAELETAFEADGLSAIAARLSEGRGRDLAVALAALLRGGGDAELATRVLEAGVDPLAAARAVAQAIAAVGADTEAPGKP